MYITRPKRFKQIADGGHPNLQVVLLPHKIPSVLYWTVRSATMPLGQGRAYTLYKPYKHHFHNTSLSLSLTFCTFPLPLDLILCRFIDSHAGVCAHQTHTNGTFVLQVTLIALSHQVPTKSLPEHFVPKHLALFVGIYNKRPPCLYHH